MTCYVTFQKKLSETSPKRISCNNCDICQKKLTTKKYCLYFPVALSGFFFKNEESHIVFFNNILTANPCVKLPSFQKKIVVVIPALHVNLAVPEFSGKNNEFYSFITNYE